MATVKLPGIGPVDSKYVYGGGALIVGIVGFAYWRARNAEPTTADYTSPDEYTEADYAVDDYGYDGGATDYAGANGGSPPTYVDQNPNPSTDSEWSSRAVEVMESYGVPTLAMLAALGKYFAGLEMTESEAAYIRQARAVLGTPPGGDKPIKVGAPTPPAPTPTDKAPGQVTGLKSWGNGPSRMTVPIAWTKVTGAAYYKIYRTDVAYDVGTSTSTQDTIGGLTPNTTYKFQVTAVSPGGKEGPKSAVFTAKTKK